MLCASIDAPAACEGAVDRQLVELAQRGDEDAFEALVRATGDRCVGIAYRILRDVDLAEDAVQSAYVSAWRDLRSLREPDRFEAWLHRTLTRACYEEARRSRRFAANIRALPIESSYAPEDVMTVVHRDQLDRGIRRLSVEQRAVLVFHHYLGLTLAEVADRLDIPIGTAKSRLHHATNALRAALDADARTALDSRERPA
jgi:RNA polymerase sigma-70 factor (ECF subfamily)